MEKSTVAKVRNWLQGRREELPAVTRNAKTPQVGKTAFYLDWNCFGSDCDNRNLGDTNCHQVFVSTMGTRLVQCNEAFGLFSGRRSVLDRWKWAQEPHRGYWQMVYWMGRDIRGDTG